MGDAQTPMVSPMPSDDEDRLYHFSLRLRPRSVHPIRHVPVENGVNVIRNIITE